MNSNNLGDILIPWQIKKSKMSLIKKNQINPSKILTNLIKTVHTVFLSIAGDFSALLEPPKAAPFANPAKTKQRKLCISHIVNLIKYKILCIPGPVITF